MNQKSCDVLEKTIGTRFDPGSNVRGDLTGGNWTFLLPGLDLHKVLCIGAPSQSTLAALARIGEEIVVVDTTSKRESLVRDWIERAEWTNVRTAQPCALTTPGEFDLVHLTGSNPTLERQLIQSRSMLVDVRGSIWISSKSKKAFYPSDVSKEDFGTCRHFSITPLFGKMRTAVPTEDPLTFGYFAKIGLNSPSLDVHTLKRLLARCRGDAPRADLLQQRAEPTGTRAENPLRNWSHRFVEGVARVEGALLAQRQLRSLIGRVGTLVRSRKEPPGPPAWIREIALTSGIGLDAWRWGLVAKGEYSSRKVLFFLFDRSRGADENRPRIVVKVTRTPALNDRLENEARALKMLHAKGFSGVVPTVAFEGHHSGLAVVGEGAVHGEPFAARSEMSASCPHARAAIRWLTELGASTAEAHVAPPEHVANTLHELLERFCRIYRTANGERDFLFSQIERIGRSTGTFPLVLQHGDPGTWNVLVNASGGVSFLDWEAAEPRGMPLWDLWYFLRSFAVSCAKRGGARNRLRAFQDTLCSQGPFGRLLLETTRAYRAQLGLEPTLVEPLFHTCWMHRALKEATRLTTGSLETGAYVSLLRYGIERRRFGILSRLFGND